MRRSPSNGPTLFKAATGHVDDVVKYGIVEYLRKRPRMRAATAIVGLIWMFGWLLSFGGFKWSFALLPAVSAWFVSPVLLWMAVVSGPDHSLTFAPPKAPDAPAAPALPAGQNSLLNPEDSGMAGVNSTCNAVRNQAAGAYQGFLFFFITGMGGERGQPHPVRNPRSLHPIWACLAVRVVYRSRVFPPEHHSTGSISDARRTNIPTRRQADRPSRPRSLH